MTSAVMVVSHHVPVLPLKSGVLMLLQVRYTCKRCGTTTTKAVNPHAWATGTVFGRCDGCQVIHKLTDNLELFHELSGPLVNSPINPDKISIPESLPQNPYMP